MKWLNNLKVKQKLLIAFLCITALIGVVGIVGIINISKINSSQEFVYNINYPGIKNISNIKSNLIQINFDVYKILNNDPNTKDLLHEIDKLKSIDDQFISDYEKNIVEDKDRAMFLEFKSLLNDYRTYRAEFVNAITYEQHDDALSAYVKFDDISNKLIQFTDKYINYNINFAKQSYINNTKIYNSTLIINSIIILAGLLLSFISGSIISSSISNKIKKVMLFSEAICNGDFGQPIEVNSQDEIDILAKSLNKASAIRKDYELKLSKNYQELEASYEEVTALEEELREKFDELTTSEEKLREAHEWYKMIMETSYDTLWDWNIQSHTVKLSRKWFDITGYDDVNVPYSLNNWLSCIHEDDIENVMNIINDHWENKKDRFSLEYRIIDNHRNTLWVSITGKTIYNSNGAAYRSVGSLKNITNIKNNEKKLEYMAYHDYLTDLPNRHYMYNKLNPAHIIQNSNNENLAGAVVFIDLDNFKYINDTMGHNFGDNLIKTIGQRLKNLLTHTDYLIRLGGDEFVMLINNTSGKAAITKLAETILHEFTTPFEIHNNSIKITTSIGIALFPQDGIEIDDLLKKSDIAMYQSKYKGKNNYTFFINSMNDSIIERMKIETYLTKALANNEFILHYQPQIKIHTGEITGFEALIRWNSPELGMIPPDKFISIAEENSMIIDIGDWVLKTACKFIKTVHETSKNYTCISVNTSVLQIMQSNFVDNICCFLKEIDLSPSYLELEITESIFIDSYDIICKKIQELKSIGIKISLDDFGKGYSSLSYLKQLPINTLKIDKSFIDDINNINSNCLVENIIMIGHKMNMDVIAEGVEIKEQLIYLRSFQCDKIQGYFFSKPLKEKDALNLIISSENIILPQVP